MIVHIFPINRIWRINKSAVSLGWFLISPDWVSVDWSEATDHDRVDSADVELPLCDVRSHFRPANDNIVFVLFLHVWELDFDRWYAVCVFYRDSPSKITADSDVDPISADEFAKWADSEDYRYSWDILVVFLLCGVWVCGAVVAERICG